MSAASEKALLPCIHVAEGDIPPRVLVCGDPARAERISRRFEHPVCLAQNREYWTYSGVYQGVPVAVTSHGVGCGGAAIAFESLWRAGARAVIRVGTCGGMQPEVTAGSLVIATAACREEGITEKMIPLSYPAVSDGETVAALIQAARDRGIAVHKGIVLTQALFYPGFLESTVKLYARAGVVAMENEAASLLVVSSLHGVKAGAILAVDAPAFELVGVDGYSQTAGGANVAQAVEDGIDIALDALIQIPLR